MGLRLQREEAARVGPEAPAPRARPPRRAPPVARKEPSRAAVPLAGAGAAAPRPRSSVASRPTALTRTLTSCTGSSGLAWPYVVRGRPRETRARGARAPGGGAPPGG